MLFVSQVLIALREDRDGDDNEAAGVETLMRFSGPGSAIHQEGQVQQNKFILCAYDLAGRGLFLVSSTGGGRGGAHYSLAFTRYCFNQSCMVYGIHKGGRGGVLYCPIAVQ